jgi:hypothetical protein
MRQPIMAEKTVQTEFRQIRGDRNFVQLVANRASSSETQNVNVTLRIPMIPLRGARTVLETFVSESVSLPPSL